MQLLDKLRVRLSDTRAAGEVPTLRRMRILVTIVFAWDGFVLASWVVRVPEVKAQVGASTAGLGLALLGISAGAVVTMMVTGRLCSRFGSRRIVVMAGVLLSLATMVPAAMRSVPALGAALLVFGAGYGALDVSMNSVAVDITRWSGRPIMPSFHAAYSFGGLCGSVVGGALAALLIPAVHLLAVGLCGLVLTVVVGTMLVRCAQPADPSAGVDTSGRRAESAPHPALPRTLRLRMLVVTFGLIALCTAYGEGAIGDWASLHLRTDLHASTSLAAAAYASFSVAMVVGRLSGTWLLGRIGRTAVLVGGGLTASVGMLLGALAPLLAVVLFGFVLVGLGLANVFPTAIGEAGALTGPGGVAAASTIGYAGMLVGPPFIGFIAEHTGLPLALTTISALAAIAAVVALVARRAEVRLHSSVRVAETDNQLSMM